MKAGVSRFKRVSGWNRVLPVLMLFAFALQSYVTQTHVHFARQAVAGDRFPDAGSKIPGVGSVAKAGTPSDRDKSPSSEDGTDCPFCQEMLSAGNYVSPSIIAVPLPSLVEFTISTLDVELPFVSAVSHDWRGRAPPRL